MAVVEGEYHYAITHPAMDFTHRTKLNIRSTDSMILRPYKWSKINHMNHLAQLNKPSQLPHHGLLCLAQKRQAKSWSPISHVSPCHQALFSDQQRPQRPRIQQDGTGPPLGPLLNPSSRISQLLSIEML